jgi:hypothetical protein
MNNKGEADSFVALMNAFNPTKTDFDENKCAWVP